jgi:hypothetical protein
MTDPDLRPATSADLLQIEQALRAAVPEAVFASPRLVRRIIRADLDLPLVWARVPHRESIELAPARLLELTDDIWPLPSALPESILLLARPEVEGIADAGRQPLLREYWRILAHGCFDAAARRLLADEDVAGPDFRDLVERVGEVPLAEATAVLAQEGLLRDPADQREALAEFIAVTLELDSFAPHLLPVWFPAVDDHGRLVRLFSTIVDADAILARTRPAALRDALAESGVDCPEAVATSGDALPKPGRLTRRAAGFIRRQSLAAARRGNDVRGALLQWRLLDLAGGDSQARGRAERGLGRRLTRLAGRLEQAVGLGSVSPGRAAAVLAALLERADGSAWSQPARLLYDLQKICVDSERESYRTRLFSWAVTLGRVPLVKPLPSQRVALVHRHAAAASRRLPALGLTGPIAADATTLVATAMRASELAVRTRLSPPIREAFAAAGLQPTALVEQAAFDKLVDELLDDVADRGFESFGSVRDAVSRSQVKLPDLAGLDELVAGDPLLRADRNLAASLDGAYRQAPAYLLAMQRLSAVAFGVPLGRAITLHVLLPFGGAWILWRGLEHIVEPVTHYSLGEPVHIYSRWLVLTTGLAIWVLMHVPAIRGAVLEGLWALGGLIHLVLVKLPRRFLRLPAVERFLKSRPVRLFRRYAWSPLVVTGCAWLLAPHDGRWLSRSNPWLPALLFATSVVVLNSPAGRALQERVLEAVGRAVQQIHARLILGLVTWIVDTFRRAVDFVEGTLYAVDEQLRFRSGESRVALAVKAVLTMLWSAVDWFVRFCVTLLIEPQLNPIKHFPVVTVSHKLLVPMIPMVAGNLAAATGMERGLALTTVTFFSTTIPGVFGFLAWELKENWRLYAANRPQTLQPAQVGRHGESMRRLLLPGFHSGTIPKLFAKLRRRLRGPAGSGRRTRPEEHLAEISHDIASFVDDECLGLLRRARATAELEVWVADVRLATNLVAIDLAAEAVAPEPLEIELCQRGGTLVIRIAAAGWLDQLGSDQQRLVRLALAGLDCLCGADFTTILEDGRSESLPVEPIRWAEWRETWERERAGSLESGSS